METVQANTLSPMDNPVTIVVLLVEFEILPEPETRVHWPEPISIEVACKMDELAQIS